jgi:hypothetical protein
MGLATVVARRLSDGAIVASTSATAAGLWSVVVPTGEYRFDAGNGSDGCGQTVVAAHGRSVTAIKIICQVP